MPTEPEITVVVGTQNARLTIAQCLGALVSQARSTPAEILVVDNSTDGTADLVAGQFPDLTVLHGPASALVPHLWGIGINRARTPVVAILSAHCIPEADWLRRVLEAIAARPAAGGVGGYVGGPVTDSSLDWAVYFARYSAFLPPLGGSGPPRAVLEIPGDNAAYRKSDLEAFWLRPEQGFWETLFHHELRLQGKEICLFPGIAVRLGSTARARDFLKVRVQHGYHFGATRPQRGSWRLASLFALPLLPPLLLWRIQKRVLQQRPDWLKHYLKAVPWLVVFLFAWSVGECAGYWKPAIESKP